MKKTIFSPLAEAQTLRVETVTDRVAVRVRKCVDGVITRDVLVDGYTYTPHVSENWLATNLAAIVLKEAKLVELTAEEHCKALGSMGLVPGKAWN